MYMSKADNLIRARKLALLFILITLTGCSQDESRQSYYKNTHNPVVIAIAYPFDSVDGDTHYVDGINLAVSEINARGGILDREVITIRKDDKSSVNSGSEIAQEFVDDPSVAAVIGHWNSSVSIPTSAIYESNQMIMLSAASTSPAFTQSGYSYIFRGIPNDAFIGQKVAEYIRTSGFNRIAIVYTDDDYGRGLANAFEDRTYEIGSLIVDRIAGVIERDIPALIKQWEASDVEALFIAGVMPEVGDLIRSVRQNGFNLPIYSGTGLDRTHPLPI